MASNTKSNPKTRCDDCGGDAYDAVVRKEMTVKHEGKQHLIVVDDLPVLRCEKCGELFGDNRTDSRIQEALCQHLGVLTPAEILRSRGFWGLTQADVARDTGLAVETISRWENCQQVPTRANDKLLRVYFADPARFRYQAELPTPAVIEEWRSTPIDPPSACSANNSYALAA